MRLLADEGASSKGLVNVPVVLFRYGERRKFLRVSGDYQDTIHTVSKAFKIPLNTTSTVTGTNTITLQTSALDVCKGADTVIDESAYPLLWNFLDEISVVLDGDAREPDSEPVSPEKEKEAVVNSSLASSPSTSRRAEKAPAKPKHKTKVHLPTPSAEEEDSVSGKPNNTTVQKTSFPDDLLDFTTTPNRTQKEQDSHRTTPDDQPWEEGRVLMEQVPVEADNEDEDYGTARAESPVSSKLGKDQPPPASQARSFKKVKKANGDGASSSSRVVDDVFSQVKQEKDNESGNTSEFPSRSERSPKKEPAPSTQNLGPIDDPRFEITIIGPENTCAQFKTRGKHQVRKVLAAACKTFGIDANNTQLVMRLEIDEDEGEYHDFVCSLSETISACGVDFNSKLFLKQIGEDYLD